MYVTIPTLNYIHDVVSTICYFYIINLPPKACHVEKKRKTLDSCEKPKQGYVVMLSYEPSAIVSCQRWFFWGFCIYTH